MYRNIGEYERKIDTNVQLVEKEIMPGLSKASERLAQEDSKHNKLLKQLEALQDADDEITGQMESLLETK